jgi:hypothetical protein
MDDQFESAEAKSSGSLPDGDYEAQIERFDFWDDNGQRPLKLVTELTVVGDKYAGMKAPSVWHDLEDPDRLGYVKGYLHLLGLEGMKLSELESALEDVVGTTVAIRVVTKPPKDGKTFRNTYINEVLGKAPTSTDDGTDNDIPF